MSARLYIGQLSSHARESDVEKFFKGYGRIRELVLKNGYGFVEFEDYQDADDAVYELNDRELCGERVRIEHARGKPRERDYRRERFPMRGSSRGRGGGGGRDKYGPPTRTEYRVIVENLSSRVSWQDLKDHMRQAGEVTYADANKQRMNEGIVEFATYGDMKSAIDKLDDTDINGRRVRLIEDRPHKSSRRRSRSRDRRSRSRSTSRYRSRSRSRRRSRSRSRSGSRSRSRDRRAHSRSRSRSSSDSGAGGRKFSRSKSSSRSRSKSHTHSRSKSPEKPAATREVRQDTPEADS